METTQKHGSNLLCISGSNSWWWWWCNSTLGYFLWQTLASSEFVCMPLWFLQCFKIIQPSLIRRRLCVSWTICKLSAIQSGFQVILVHLFPLQRLPSSNVCDTILSLWWTIFYVVVFWAKIWLISTKDYEVADSVPWGQNWTPPQVESYIVLQVHVKQILWKDIRGGHPFC